MNKILFSKTKKHMSLKHILKGERFGKLTATGNRERRRSENGRSAIFDEVICDCGVKKYIRREFLKSGHTKSCGCLINEINRKRLATHGDTGEKLYRTRWGIQSRCYNKKDKRYDSYGGRGIKCLRGNYEEFKNDMYDSYKKHVEEYGENNTSIDRVDNNGNYCKNNCKWSTNEEQASNRNFCWKNKFGISLNDLSLKYHLKPKSIRNIYGKLNRNFEETINYLNKKLLYNNKNK